MKLEAGLRFANPWCFIKSSFVIVILRNTCVSVTNASSLNTIELIFVQHYVTELGPRVESRVPNYTCLVAQDYKGVILLQYVI